MAGYDKEIESKTGRPLRSCPATGSACLVYLLTALASFLSIARARHVHLLRDPLIACPGGTPMTEYPPPPPGP